MHARHTKRVREWSHDLRRAAHRDVRWPAGHDDTHAHTSRLHSTDLSAATLVSLSRQVMVGDPQTGSQAWPFTSNTRNVHFRLVASTLVSASTLLFLTLFALIIAAASFGVKRHLLVSPVGCCIATLLVTDSISRGECWVEWRVFKG